MAVTWSVHLGAHEEFPSHFNFVADALIRIADGDVLVRCDRQVLKFYFSARQHGWEGHWDADRRENCQALIVGQVFLCLHDILWSGSGPKVGGAFVPGEPIQIMQEGLFIADATVEDWHDRSIVPKIAGPLLKRGETGKNYKKDMIRH